MTDIGAHHFDIAQWALDMDHSGPVDIIPPEDPNAARGVKYVYASGVEMFHGGPGGCVFEGTEGKLHINRGHLSSEPESIIKEPLGGNSHPVAKINRPPSANSSISFLHSCFISSGVPKKAYWAGLA